MDTQEFLTDKYTIFKGYAGSHAYGTSLPTSDVDFRGLFCANPINVRTPFYPVREVEDGSEEDTKYYELSHFMKLCLDCNPNIIEMLWIHRDDIVSTSPGYEILREHRAALLSSKIAFTTSGYAMAQLKRIKSHNKWINNPQPIDPPEPVDYLTMIQWYGEEKVMPHDFNPRRINDDARLVPYGHDIYGLYIVERHGLMNTKNSSICDEFGKLNTTFEGDRALLPPPTAIVKFNKTEYKIEKDKHTNYWTWRNNRNEARAELEHDHGYDTKHAMHLVRLMRMGKEALTQGEIIVKRPDAAELLAIRNGDWTYDELLEYAEDVDNEIRNVCYKETSLPMKPNLKFAAELLMDVQDCIWSAREDINTHHYQKKGNKYGYSWYV